MEAPGGRLVPVLAWRVYSRSVVAACAFSTAVDEGGHVGRLLDRLWPRIYHAAHKGEKGWRTSYSACLLPCLCVCVKEVAA